MYHIETGDRPGPVISISVTCYHRYMIGRYEYFGHLIGRDIDQSEASHIGSTKARPPTFFNWWRAPIKHPSRHETPAQCLINVGPSSTTMAQYLSKIGWMYRVSGLPLSMLSELKPVRDNRELIFKYIDYSLSYNMWTQYTPIAPGLII